LPASEQRSGRTLERPEQRPQEAADPLRGEVVGLGQHEPRDLLADRDQALSRQLDIDSGPNPDPNPGEALDPEPYRPGS
jgi:hypothetical protein